MIKKNRYILAVALPLLMMAGCQKTIDTQERTSGPAERATGAGYEAYAVDEIDFGATKTWLTHDYKVAWIDGDEVRCIYGGTFTATILGDEVTHAFLAPKTWTPGGSANDVMMPDRDGFYNVFYPASLVGSNGITTTLPATQYYNAESILSVNPMYAKDTCEVLQFHNICGLMQLRLQGSKTVKTIEVWADKAVSGTFTVVEEEKDGVPTYKARTTVPATTGDYKGVKLDCTRPGATGTAYPEGGVVLSKEGSLFYLALPDSTYNWMKIRITTKDGYVAFKKIEDKIKIRRNTVYYTEFTPVWGVETAVTGSTVTKVLWSLSNIGARNEWEYGDWFCFAGTEPLYRTVGREYKAADGKYEVTLLPDCWKGGFEDGYVKENAAFYDKGASTPGWYKYTATDGKTTLDVWDDPVTRAMGPGWRTPTKAEMASVTGGSAASRGPISDPDMVKGVEITGLNSGKLFFPYAGYADSTVVKKTGESVCLWSAEVDGTDAGRNTANCIFEGAAASKDRGLGFSVRGVCPTESTDDYH